jgi:glycerophosphoryl diester phosphodiesterase
VKSAPVTAHRGLARLYPENTRASVLGALRAGLDKVEIDVQLSSDGVPVVLHDPTLDRLCGRSGDVRRWPWARLKKLSAHEPGRFGRRFAKEKLSSLAALARSLAGKKNLKTLFVELKEESLLPFGREPMLEAVVKVLRPIQRRCVLISFDLKVLQVARANTRFPVGPVLRSLRQLQLPDFKALRPDWIFCDARLLPRRGPLKPLFGRARSCVYEVPEASRARDLLSRGITALETLKGDSLVQELALFR